MKIMVNLSESFIDVWNEEKEMWERYAKVSLVPEEEKKLPEKLDDEYSNNANGLKVVWSSSQQHTLKNKINEIIDYLESKEKGE